MKNLHATFFAICVFVPAAAVASSSESVDSAYKLCRVMDGTGLMSKPCEVSGWGSSVNATIDMTASEARKLCGQIAGEMRSRGVRFDSGWKLQIFSPYSGSNSIAFCNL